MIEDKERWNQRHVQKPMPHVISDIVKKYVKYSRVGKAIDIACGIGRNTHYLDELGFEVDAVDLSDYALSQVKDTQTINKIEVDLDGYDLQINTYDLILNINYLNRRLMKQMQDALLKGGVIIFETFIKAHDREEQGSMNPDYLLEVNELLAVFKDMQIIYYEERDDINLRGEQVKIASMVAKKC